MSSHRARATVRCLFITDMTKAIVTVVTGTIALLGKWDIMSNSYSHDISAVGIWRHFVFAFFWNMCCCVNIQEYSYWLIVIAAEPGCNIFIAVERKDFNNSNGRNTKSLLISFEREAKPLQPPLAQSDSIPVTKFYWLLIYNWPGRMTNSAIRSAEAVKHVVNFRAKREL